MPDRDPCSQSEALAPGAGDAPGVLPSASIEQHVDRRRDSSDTGTSAGRGVRCQRRPSGGPSFTACVGLIGRARRRWFGLGGPAYQWPRAQAAAVSVRAALRRVTPGLARDEIRPGHHDAMTQRRGTPPAKGPSAGALRGQSSSRGSAGASASDRGPRAGLWRSTGDRWRGVRKPAGPGSRERTATARLCRRLLGPLAPQKSQCRVDVVASARSWCTRKTVSR